MTTKTATKKCAICNVVGKVKCPTHSLRKSPTLKEIACDHKFKSRVGLPKNVLACTKCDGIQTQFKACNGNCRCGGQQ